MNDELVLLCITPREIEDYIDESQIGGAYSTVSIAFKYIQRGPEKNIVHKESTQDRQL